MSKTASGLCIIQDSHLWRADPQTGAYTDLGPGWGWPTLMANYDTESGDSVYVVQNSRLWSVDCSTGSYSVLGGPDWGGATSIAVTRDGPRIIQNSRLWKVNGATGGFTQLGGPDWSGATLMTATFRVSS